jgi:hypothetical protein
MNDDAVIYDFETLSQDQFNGVILSCAMLTFNRADLIQSKYTYSGLLAKATMIKFDVADQVKRLKRTIDPETLKWWGKQGEDALKLIKPSSSDVKLEEIVPWFKDNIGSPKRVYTRNNTFDPIFMAALHTSFDAIMPYPFWVIRDTKSTIDALTWDQEKFEDGFFPRGVVPEMFVKHDPVHDIAVDVMRLQDLLSACYYDDEIPF